MICANSECGKEFAISGNRKKYCCFKCKERGSRFKRKIATNKWLVKNKDRVSKKKKEWNVKNIIKVNDQGRVRLYNWINKNPIRYKQKIAKSKSKSVNSLTDGYLKQLLKTIGKKYESEIIIPQELIELKKIHLKGLRTIKQKQL